MSRLSQCRVDLGIYIYIHGVFVYIPYHIIYKSSVQSLTDHFWDRKDGKEIHLKSGHSACPPALHPSYRPLRYRNLKAADSDVTTG